MEIREITASDAVGLAALFVIVWYMANKIREM